MAFDTIPIDDYRYETSLMTTLDEVVPKLGTRDKLLPVWIVGAMAAGLGLGALAPGFDELLAGATLAGVSLPIAVGLLVMMYPVLAKVRYDRVGAVVADRRVLTLSLVLNWVLGPALMFALAWLMLPDLPEYRTGLVIVGLARCIAMVLVWNDLARGDAELGAVLVAVNSVFQILAFSALAWFYLAVLPSWLGLPTAGIEVSVGAIAVSVVVFLGVPLVAGFLTRYAGERARGRVHYENVVLPRLAPWALYGLLFTIVVLFALQGGPITERPFDVVRIALPLLAYFAVMWAGSLLLARGVGLDHARSVTIAFTAAGNNFELAIAVSIGAFGVTSGQALAGVVGPLIEVPVLVALVWVALRARPLFSRSASISSKGSS
jgi:ACR3 family arsenite transporter